MNENPHSDIVSLDEVAEYIDEETDSDYLQHQAILAECLYGTWSKELEEMKGGDSQ